jgi:hypothetical protein
MHSGQRRALATMMPFSIEEESFGRLAMSHSRILTGSPRMEERLNLEVWGMLAELRGWCGEEKGYMRGYAHRGENKNG